MVKLRCLVALITFGSAASLSGVNLPPPGRFHAESEMGMHRQVTECGKEFR